MIQIRTQINRRDYRQVVKYLEVNKIDFHEQAINSINIIADSDDMKKALSYINKIKNKNGFFKKLLRSLTSK